jgi:hypothetical protein
VLVFLVFVSSHYFIIVNHSTICLFSLLLQMCKVIFHYFASSVFFWFFACTLFYCRYSQLSFLSSFSASLFCNSWCYFFSSLLFYDKIFSPMFCCFANVLFLSTIIHLLHHCHQVFCISFFFPITIYKVQNLSIIFLLSIRVLCSLHSLSLLLMFCEKQFSLVFCFHQ